MAGLLLERGADVNWIAKNGLTSLHLTAQEDAVNVATILVKNGAQIDPKTKVDSNSITLCTVCLHTRCPQKNVTTSSTIFLTPVTKTIYAYSLSNRCAKKFFINGQFYSVSQKKPDRYD